MGSPSRAGAVLAALVLAACTLPPLTTPVSSPPPSPSVTTAPTVTLSASPSASPAPDLSAVPDFAAGELITTRIDGLRVRRRPGTGGLVVTGLLPVGANLQVVMGPIVVDDLGWYLVTDADDGEPQFEEGWVAAGFEPDAWMARTADAPDPSPFVASYAGTGDADHGPIGIAEGEHAIRWIARDHDGGGCRFTVSLASAGGGDPVAAIRSTLGDRDLVPGTLQPSAFDALDVRGQAFVEVRSDCAWALVIQRVREPGASPAPSSGG